MAVVLVEGSDEGVQGLDARALVAKKFSVADLHAYDEVAEGEGLSRCWGAPSGLQVSGCHIGYSL